MYQIVLVENKKKIKVLHSYSREHDANYRFEKLKSQEVIFPKIKVYKNKKLVDVVYEILLLKKREEGDVNRVIKNELGKFVEETVDDEDWVIMDTSYFHIEESFNVSDANRKLTAKEIIEHVVISNKQKKAPKQVLMLNNKIVIEGLDLYMVTCKNIDETIRLYNKIRTYCFDNKIGDIIFFGSVPKENRKVWYKKIHDRTGIGYNRLYRSNSR
ncbi:MAG: hypothetical protein ACK5OW_00145 [bacterium]|jgi:hypothetical protein